MAIHAGSGEGRRRSLQPIGHCREQNQERISQDSFSSKQGAGKVAGKEDAEDLALIPLKVWIQKWETRECLRL